MYRGTVVTGYGSIDVTDHIWAENIVPHMNPYDSLQAPNFPVQIKASAAPAVSVGTPNWLLLGVG